MILFFHHGKRSYYIIVLCAVCVITMLCSCGEKQNTDKSVVKVKLAEQSFLKFRHKIRIHGNIEPEECADICARIDGVLDNLMVEEGDSVDAGTVLFQSDKINLESEVEIANQNLKVSNTGLRKAEIQLETEKVKLEKAGIDYKRAKTLLENNVISKDSFERTELIWKEAGAGVKSAESNTEHARALVEQAGNNVKIAKKKLEDSIIKSPFKGVVTKTNKELGEYAKRGECVLRIENPDCLELSALISSNYYTEIQEGKTKAVIYTLAGKKLAETTISYRSPSIDPLSRTFELKIHLPGNKELTSGMLCSVALIFSEKTAYGVPNEAIMSGEENKSIVFIPDKGKAKAVEVNTGIVDNGYTEVTGLPKDTRVIIEGQAFLNQGTEIVIIKNTN